MSASPIVVGDHPLPRESRWLAGENRVLEMIARGTPLTDVLTALCLLVEDLLDGRCSIMVVNEARTRVHAVAAPHLPAGFLRGLEPGFGSEGSPCRLAALSGSQVLASDLVRETRWPCWVELARQHGLWSCWATPIASSTGTVIGTFSIYHSDSLSPDQDHQRVISQVTHLASIAIERAQSEAALRRSEEELARAQRISRTGSFDLRSADGQLTLSAEAQRIFGLAPSPTWAALRGVLHADDVGLFDSSLRSESAEPCSFECRLLQASGEQRAIELMGTPTRDARGELSGWSVVVRDITDRKRTDDTLHALRTQLAHVERVRTLGTLTASIAHEVSQPLAGLKLNASTCRRLLESQEPDLDQLRKAAERMVRDAARATDVITRLRAMFRKETDPPKDVELNLVVRELATLLSRELREGRISLQLSLSEPAVVVLGDRVQLQQVVLNLMLNAIEAMAAVDDTARTLEISTLDSAGDIVLRVRDTGVGIAAEDLSSVFEPFYTSKRDGMGIGLAVSSAIVEGHAGKIWVERNEAAGVTFCVRLPKS